MAQKEITDELIVVDAKRYNKVKKALEASQAGGHGPVPPNLDEKENTRELVVVDVRRYKKIKKALAESEERYRHLFENVPIGIYRTTPDGRIVDSNPALVKMLGYESFTELASRNLEKDYAIVNIPRADFIKRLKCDGEVIGLEAIWKKKDGSLIHVRENAKLTKSEGGEVLFEGTVEDITQSKLAEEAQKVRAYQMEILNSIISKGNNADSLEALLEIILDCVVAPLAFDTAAIFMYDHENRKGKLVAHRGMPKQFVFNEKYLSIDHLPFSRVLQQGQPYFIDYTRKNNPYYYEKWGWLMASSVPLVSKGRVIGALNAASSQRDAFSPGEKNILELIGKEAGTLISKLRTETALRESEKYYRTLVDTSPDIIVVMDLAARMITVNQQFLKAGGYFYDEVIGACSFDFVVGLDRDFLEKKTAGFIKRDKVTESEYLFKKKDGSEIPLEVSAAVLHDKSGDPEGIIAIGRDISQRKRAERDIEEKNRVLATLNEISLELAAMPPAADINEYVSRKLMSITHAIYVGVNHYNKGTRQLQFVSANSTSKVVNKVSKILGKRIEDVKYDVSEAMYKEIITTVVGYRKTLHEASFGAISETASSLIHRLFKIDHFIGMALIVEGELIGTAIMAIVKGAPPVSEELLKSFSHIVSVSIRRGQAESQLVASEEKFKNLFYISPDSIILSRLDDGKIVSVNKGFAKILGYEESEVVGKTNREINIYKNPEDQCEIIDALKTKGAAENFECRFVSKSGNNVLGLVSTVIIDIKGEKYIMSTIRDISERRRAEEQLRFLSSITENTSDSIMVTDADFAITYVNKVGEHFFGYTLGELKGRTPELFNAEPMAAQIQKEIYKTVAAGETYQGESLNRRKDGSTFFCEYKVMPLKDEHGKIQAYFSVQRDVSERKRSEEELRLSEETFRCTFEAIPNPAYIWVRQADGRIVLNKFNLAAEKITQGKIREYLGIEADRLYAGSPDLLGKIKLAMTQGLKLSEEILYHYQSTGQSKWLVVDYIRTAPDKVLVITRDISERKEAESKLLAYQEQLRALTSELTLIEEKERRRIASELHDQIGQNLALCKLKVAALEKAVTPESAAHELAVVRRLLECSIQDARSLIFDLSPPILYELGFPAALEWLAEWIGEQYHIPVEFENRFGDEAMESDRQVILFQVVRELLVNVGKHSQASQAKVILSLEQQSLKIQVNDDGVGFDATRIYDPRAQNGSFGFFSMRERLNYLGGRLEVRSRPGQGSQVSLTVPPAPPGNPPGKENK